MINGVLLINISQRKISNHRPPIVGRTTNYTAYIVSTGLKIKFPQHKFEYYTEKTAHRGLKF
jgi:hypothetical protein